jgi:hypothetical protein
MLLLDVLEQYFSPFVSQRYCLYFYILSLIFGITFLLFLFGGLIFLINNYGKVKLNSAFVFNWTLFIANNFVAYFVNRLLYSMCLNSMR